MLAGVLMLGILYYVVRIIDHIISRLRGQITMAKQNYPDVSVIGYGFLVFFAWSTLSVYLTRSMEHRTNSKLIDVERALPTED